MEDTIDQLSGVPMTWVPRSDGTWTPGWVQLEMPWNGHSHVLFWHQQDQKWASKSVPTERLRKDQPEEVRGHI